MPNCPVCEYRCGETQYRDQVRVLKELVSLRIPELRTDSRADTVSKFLQLIGLEIGGRPGRPTKDYSREYELKVTKSWAQVAAQALLENAELREEFGGRTYESLPFEEQENLKNRIREGVRSYAERMGKPFPIERV